MAELKIKSRISELRQRTGITQKQLAELVGVTDITVANWERGRTGLDEFQRVAKLCAVLKCRPDELFEEEKESKNKKGKTR